jgi:Flp pilus assembly pilin Flp
MFKFLNKRKGQSTLEYAVLIVIIIAALLAMNQYIKRGLQGRLKSSTDDIGDQFSPGNSNYQKIVTTASNQAEEFGLSGVGVQSTRLLQREQTNTNESTNIINTQAEFYGN